MRKILYVVTLMLPCFLVAQVKIGDNPNSIHPNSILEMEGSDKALVLTRLSQAQMMGIQPLTGALVYNTDVQCIHYYDGTTWINLCDVTNVIQDLRFASGVITLTGDPDATAIDLSNYDTDALDDFSGSFNDLTDVPVGLADGDDNTTTNLSQDLGTGVISYTNEIGLTQTANTVGTEINNSISVGSNGGAFYESPIKAFGKIASDGSIDKATPGIIVTQLGGNGNYQVDLPVGLVSDADYIIQLSLPSREGAGNDDPGITYRNQTATSFEVIIGDNDNGGTDRTRYNSEFMFSILDF
ncbi:MAG: hypothetical protein AAF554_11320 [Bacteroidota bacterium]